MYLRFIMFQQKYTNKKEMTLISVKLMCMALGGDQRKPSEKLCVT